MSLSKGVQKEIDVWKAKIAAQEARISRMKLSIKSLQRLLDMAKMVEEQQ